MEQHVCVCAYEWAHVYKFDKENLSNLILILPVHSISEHQKINIHISIFYCFWGFFHIFLIGPRSYSYIPQSIQMFCCHVLSLESLDRKM